MDESAILEERRDNRPRSNTWPLPDPSEFTKSEREADQSFKQLNEGPKKSSRKNAWGNLSYADLITQAIQSSADKRLTLSQIYEWMVNTVPYFRDKGDSNSSAGWKNSIRHNLSLHSKFVRVQNEGNGKSSWWMLNPDAKGGKTSRRRSGSLDSAPKSERKRGRTKKEKIKEEDECPSSPHLSVNRTRDVNRANSPGNASPTNSSSSDSLLTIPESESPLPFPLGESFARPRTSSNASTVSSLGGRLSPIPSQADELEIAEDPVPTSFGMTSTPNPAAEELSQLADSMSLDSYAPESNRLKQTLTPVTSLLPSDPAPRNDLGIAAVSNSMGSNMSNSFDTGYDSSGYLQPAQHRPRQSLSPEMLRPTITATQPVYNGLQVLAQSQQQRSRFQGNYHSPQELSSHQNNNPPQMNTVYCRDQEMEVQQTPVNMFPSYQSSFVSGSTAFVNTLPQNCSFTDPYLQQICAPPGMMTNGVHSLQGHPFSRDIRMTNNNQLELMNEKFPSDLELDAFHGGLDCDIDSIIHDELNMGDGGLDFNFEQLITQLPNNPLTIGELRGGLY